MSTTVAEKKQEKAQNGNIAIEKTRRFRTICPSANVYESPEEVVVVMDLPGVSKDKLDITLEEDRVEIRGEQESGDGKGRLLLHEKPYCSFYRVFRMTGQFDREKISAELMHGTLVLRLPKSEEARPRRIAIQGD